MSMVKNISRSKGWGAQSMEHRTCCISFAEDSLSILSTRVLLLLAGIVQGVLIARLLGPAAKGALSIIILLPSLLVSMGHLGIGNANLYFMGKRRFSFQSVLSNSLALSVMLGGFLISTCLISVAFLKDTLFDGIAPVLVAISAFTIPFTLFIKYVGYIFLGRQMILERNLMNILQELTTLICIVVFVLFLRLRIAGALISMLVGLLLAMFYSLLRLGLIGSISIRFNYELFRKSIGYGIKPYLALIILSLNYKSDIFLVKYFLTNTDVGYYSLAVSIANILWHIPTSVGMITYARVAFLSPEQANELTSKACRNTLSASFIVGIALLCACRFFIPLVYGQVYAPSVSALTILLPGVLAMTIFTTLHGDLAGRGRPDITIYVFSGALLANIVLNVILIPEMGIEGAALASTMSYATGSVVLAYIFSQLTNTRLRKLILPQRCDIQDYRMVFARLRSKIIDQL